MMQPILSCYNLIHRDLEVALRVMVEAGFSSVSLFSRPPYVPVSLEEMDEAQWKSLKSSLVGYHLSVPVVYYSSDLATDSGRETFKRQAARAHELGASVIDTGALARNENESDEAWGERLAGFAEQLRFAGRELEATGMRLCLETHGGATGTPEQCILLMRMVGSSAVRIAYDPANIVYYEGVAADDRLEELSPYIGHIHLKDKRGGKDVADFPAVGEGELDFASILGRLLAKGFPGPITLERAPAPDDAALPAVARRSYELMRGWLG
ncbi:MAG: sugar phosphate isomerase/epimerase [Armatimonadetes bacterium]|nr:sugar phosphate isomerase/epimerase [Armatimonadota bacterium]